MLKKIRKLFACCLKRKKIFKLKKLAKYFRKPSFISKPKKIHDSAPIKKKIVSNNFNKGNLNNKNNGNGKSKNKGKINLDVEMYQRNKTQLMGSMNKQLLVMITDRKIKEKIENHKNFCELTDIDSSILKFYKKRFSLFSKYDEGIQLDTESWYSVTPEPVAKDLAERLNKDWVVLDAFCGAGGNTIQFAGHCKKVIGNDLDPKKIILAKNNAAIYNVLENINFSNEDFLNFNSDQKIDLVFLAPPWGGLDYVNQKKYYLKDNILPDISEMIRKAFKISEKVIFSLPRNIIINELIGLLVDSLDGVIVDRASIEIENMYLNNKFIMTHVFFGNASKISKSTEFSHIYTILNDNDPKKAFPYKEFIKNVVKKIGMIKLINMLPEIESVEEFQLNFLKFCKILKDKGIVTQQDFIPFNLSHIFQGISLFS